MVFKKDLTPLSKGGAITKHRGKGSKPFPSRGQVNALTRPPTNTMNDYAKATPMPSPQGFDTDNDGM